MVIVFWLIYKCFVDGGVVFLEGVLCGGGFLFFVVKIEFGIIIGGLWYYYLMLLIGLNVWVWYFLYFFVYKELGN